MISSSQRLFVPAFSLGIKHDYYPDHRCPDFLIEPSGDTQKLLQNRRGRLKSDTDSVSVYVEPDLMRVDGTSFVFRLRLRNPDFALFTDMRDISTEFAPLFTNEASVPAADERGQPINHQFPLLGTDRPPRQQETFRVNQPAATERFTLGGKPIQCNWKTQFEIAGSETVTNIVDYDKRDKIVTVNSQSAKKGEPFNITYPAQPPPRRDIFAHVEIHVDDAWEKIGRVDWVPLHYEIRFAARSTLWIYYIGTDRTNADFRIEDGDQIVSFPQSRRTALSPEGDPGDELATWLALQYSDPRLRWFRFVSAEPVPCQQTLRKRIQLLDGQDALISALPNPPLRSVASNPLGGDLAKERNSVFQVVKHLTHSFPTSGA